MSASPASKKEIKQALTAALLGKLEAELENMRRAAKDAREAATHEEAKPENDKDTRALEASYLAAGQGARVRELEGAIKSISGMALPEIGAGRPIQSSAVVTLEDAEEVKTIFFVAPFGGGTTLTVPAFTAQVVTPQSPLGQALLGHTQGETIELRAKGKAREMTIVEVW